MTTFVDYTGTIPASWLNAVDGSALSAAVSAIAALTPAANKVPYFTGTGTAALASFSDFALAAAAALTGRITITPNTTHDLDGNGAAGTTLATSMILPLASTFTIATGKHLEVISLRPSFTTTGTGQFIGVSVQGTVTSPGSNFNYGMVSTITAPAGSGKITAFYARGIATASYTGTVVGASIAVTSLAGTPAAQALNISVDGVGAGFGINITSNDNTITGWGVYVDPSIRILNAAFGYAKHASSTGDILLALDSDATTELFSIDSAGRIAVGAHAALAYLHLKAGTATAGTAPIRLTSGTVLTSPVAGCIEFTTDALYFTITTGAARKTIAFLESPVFTTAVTLPNAITGGSATVFTAAAFTHTGNLNLSGSLSVFQFVGGAIASRTKFQSNIADGNTTLMIVPNGTSITSTLLLCSDPDPATDACSIGQIQINHTSFTIDSNILNAGTVRPMYFKSAGILYASLTITGSFVVGTGAALATSVTDGFLYIPTCAGTPNGSPTAITGGSPMIVDSTNNLLYFYSGGAWVAAT